MQNYAVVIHEDPEGGLWAEVPALPGCYFQGETVDALKHNIREAIAGVLEVLREEGRKPKIYNGISAINGPERRLLSVIRK